MNWRREAKRMTEEMRQGEEKSTKYFTCHATYILFSFLHFFFTGSHFALTFSAIIESDKICVVWCDHIRYWSCTMHVQQHQHQHQISIGCCRWWWWSHSFVLGWSFNTHSFVSLFASFLCFRMSFVFFHSIISSVLIPCRSMSCERGRESAEGDWKKRIACDIYLLGMRSWQKFHNWSIGTV